MGFLPFLNCARLLATSEPSLAHGAYTSLSRHGSGSIFVRTQPASVYGVAGRHWTRRRYSATHSPENVNVEHAQWLTNGGNGKNGQENSTKDDFDDVAPGRGKLSPTTSHLFKLILPLDALAARIRYPHADPPSDSVPTVFLLHPSQPMSHVARLVASSLPDRHSDISFRCAAPSGRLLQWSESTDVGDFVRDAGRASEFTIRISQPREKEALNAEREIEEHNIVVDVPTFADRTRFLRRRLDSISRELKSVESLKRQCDKEARRGAKRVAVGGLGMLVVYWGVVARLTFWDYGWDVMEPITYLSGLSTVILGYLWFLYQGREVSYTSMLDSSIITRRQALYNKHGFDIDRWNTLHLEERNLRAEIAQIAQDYEHGETAVKEEPGKSANDRTAKEEVSAGEKRAQDKDPHFAKDLSAQDRAVMDSDGTGEKTR